jgi:lipoate-protein ligase A
MRIRFLCQEQIAPAYSLAIDHYFLHTVQQTALPILRVYSFAGDVVLLGRYHATAPFPTALPLILTRRLSGGRVVPGGEGFVQFSLVFPHRSALFSEDPYYLAPFQVLNRYLRGVLHGLKMGGIDVFYPGRDLLTVHGKPLGWVSFTTADNGALLCEGGIAVGRDLSLLPALLDQADPHGVIPCQFFAPERVTSIARMLGKPLPFVDFARMLCHGFAQQFALECVAQELRAEEHTMITALVEQYATPAWLHSRPVRADLPFHATAASQLGTLQVRFSLQADHTLAEVQLSGDFIANPKGLAALEAGLRGCRCEREALWQVVDRIFLQPEHYLLGIGPLHTLPEVVLQGKSITSP